MCGICGWVDFERDLRGERATVDAMTATMTCRGPDAGGVWDSPHAALGHRRLAVIDRVGGAQPMRAPQPAEVVLTFSGEIYNHPDLRRELEACGHASRTRSDTEVLLHAYLRWGEACVSRLNGMFAFAVWDGLRQELLLARDRLGVKPLYYAPRPHGILFGSEPKAILAHPEFDPAVDAEGLAELFSQMGARTPGHGTYRGLFQVRPGWTLRVSRAGLVQRPYWRLEARPHSDDLARTVATVRDRLEAIVQRQVASDVPLCSLLSGGLDSSLVAALAGRSPRLAGGLTTFSVDFAGAASSFRPDRLRPSHDEPFAQAVARHLGSRHTTVTLDAPDLIGAQWEPLAAHDLPTMGDMYTSMYLLFKGVRAAATVALSGEAADEVFGGYAWYHDERMLASPTFPWAAMGCWNPLLTDEAAAALRLREYGADRYAQALAEVPRLTGEGPRERRIREVLHLGLTRWLPELLDRKDRLSMAVGLEVRVPFCDHELVEYAWNVPWAMKEAGGSEKGLLRAAARDLLPSTVLGRRKSIYPGAVNPAYAAAVDTQIRELLADPGAPLFQLVNRQRLAAAYAADPALPGRMAIQPSPTAPAAFLLDIDAWLRRYRVRLL